MERRSLGKNGPEVGAIGYGAMSLSSAYGSADEAESLDALAAVVESGIDMIDTAEAYGGGHNEELVGRFLRESGAKIFLSTKFGIYFDAELGRMKADGRPENVHRAVDGSLSRLGIECIDLYYAHRIDPGVPIEDTVGAMAELVRAGKIAHVGLSACSADTIRRAAAVHPVTAVQSEYSLWTRSPEEGVLDACDEVGAGFVPYSPLGRGLIVDKPPTADELSGFHKSVERYQGENLEHNLALGARVKEIADELGVSASQLALAWTTAQRPTIVPIFGTRRRARVEENAAAGDLRLSSDVLERLDQVCPRGAAKGNPLPEMIARLNQD